MYRFLLWLKKPGNTLWVTPAIGALLAVFFALAAKFGVLFLPPDILPDIDSVMGDNLLDILSNSMLAVSTFSLSIMVAAFAAASGNATPRATSLVMADDNTRVTIASFISAFVYALIGKIALSLGYYAQNRRFILFISTIAFILYVIVTLINWVRTLSGLGRLENTIEKIRHATQSAYHNWLTAPNLGTTGACPEQDADDYVLAPHSGYLTHINIAGLHQLSQENPLHIHISVRPGHFLYRSEEIAHLYGTSDETLRTRIAQCFVLDKQRTYTQDPRFGLIVLSEVAQRALSPAVNDPGTALAIIHTLSTLLTDTEADVPPPPDYPQLSIIAANPHDFIRQPFDPIARDGAGCYEVALRLQKALGAIAAGRPEFAATCRKQAERALQYARALPVTGDYDSLERLHRRYFPDGDDAQT